MSGRRHPKKTPEAKQIVAAARNNPAAVCWWCGDRPAKKANKHGGKYEPWEADHISPLVPGSPLAAACQECNRGRHGRLPDRKAIQRLCHSPDVVRHVAARDRLRHGGDTGKAVEEWLLDASRRFFGNANHINEILAATASKKMTDLDERGYIVDCWRENKLAAEANLTPS